jgi:Na+-translocating ferredoxin:NAD+ oxidoreductase subunit A
MVDFFTILLAGIFVNNFVLTKFLGLCPFLGTSNNANSSSGMSIAVIFVLTFASFITYSVNILVLKPFDLEFLQTLVFILIIASLVQVIEMLLKKYFITLYQALGIFLPLITTNCAVLGVALLNTTQNNSLYSATLYGFAAGCGFALALIILTSIRQNLHNYNLPKVAQGNAIVFITIGIIAMAFMGFTNIG